MYPLNVMLIGFTGTDALFEVRRELHNASAVVESEYPDVAAALAALALLPGGKRLFVFYAKSPEDLSRLEHLNETHPGQPILVVLEAGNDPALSLRLIRAGASQVVTLPLVTEDCQTALHRLALQFGQVVGESTVIAVSGASAGCGATTVALNLAREIAFVHQRPTILVEMSFQLGQLACNLNIEPPFTTADLLGDIDRLDLESVRRALTEVAPNLLLLAGPYQGIVPNEVSHASVVQLLNYLRQLARVVVVDLPCRFDTVYFEVAALANRLVLVADQKISSLHALRLALDALAQRETAAGKLLVINRYDPNNEAFTLQRLTDLLKPERLLPIANDYPHLSAASNDGRPLRDAAPACRPLADIDRLAAAVLGDDRPAAPKTSFFSRLLQSFHS